MTTQTEALKLAQKALSNRNAPVKMIYEALHAIKEALAQPEFAIGDIRALRHRIHELEGEVIGYKQILDAQPGQEPVARVQDLDEVKRKHLVYEKGMDWKDFLYTTPPQRTWVRLTDEEIYKIYTKDGWNGLIFSHAIEAKLKEKNT